MSEAQAGTAEEDGQAPNADDDVSTETQDDAELEGGTLASGSEAPISEDGKPYWPDDWRQKLAGYVGAGDEKSTAKELKRLEKIADPSGLYASYRAIENTWASRNFVKVPGKDATPEDVAEYRKSIGVPDTPDGYFSNLKLEEGLVVPEDDMNVVKGLTEAVHLAGATPEVVSATLNYMLKQQEDAAAALDESDSSFRGTAERELKEEYGDSYRRYVNNIGTLFASAPGGMDMDNEESVYARLLGGRLADGAKIGDDPDVVRWFVHMANNINPAGAVVEDGNQSGKSIESEIKEIEGSWKDPKTKRAYYKDEKQQARYRQLLETQQKIQARA